MSAIDPKRTLGISQKSICERCKGLVKIIACTEDPAVIEKILKHQKEQAIAGKATQSPQGRAPPQIKGNKKDQSTLIWQ